MTAPNTSFLAFLPAWRRYGGRRRLTFAAALMATAAAPAFAQLQVPGPLQVIPDAPPPVTPAASAPAAADLEPVVVSGSGLGQRMFDTPYAISVVDAATLRQSGPMVNLSEALARVPGLSTNLRNNYAQDLQISSRGFGARSTFGVRGIRLYTDGIPASTPDGQGQVSNFDLAGAARIEVLRGPFSALYGNSSGGVISLISAPPQERAAMIDTDIGSDGLRQVRLGVEAPLGQGWDIRAQASRFETDGFRPQSEARRSLGNLRIGWRGELDTLTLIINTIDQPAQDPLGLTREQFDANPDQTAAVATQFNTRKDTEQTQAGAQWRHRFANFGPMEEGIFTIYNGRRGVTQWQAIPVATQQSSPRSPGGVIDFDRDYSGIDARLIWRWDVGAGRLAQIVAGAASDMENEYRRGFENFTGVPPNQVLGATGALRRKEKSEVQTDDVYAQGSLDFGPTVTSTVGVRSGRLKITSHDEYLANGDDSGHLRYTYTNPVGALQWRVLPSLNLYVSAGQGFESPTLTELAYRADGTPGLNSALKPQSSRQVEVGAKWRNDAAHVSVDAALFRADTDDEIGVQTNSGGRSTYQNVGRTRRKGAEVSGQWKPIKSLRALLALTWLDAQYRDGFFTCAGVPCLAPTVQVPAGNRIAGTSTRNAFAEVAWQPIEPTELAVEVRTQSNVPVNDLNSDFAPGATTLAVRASHNIPVGGGKLELLARVDNIGDHRYAGSVIVNESNGRYFEPAAGRTVLVGAHWRVLF